MVPQRPTGRVGFHVHTYFDVPHKVFSEVARAMRGADAFYLVCDGVPDPSCSMVTQDMSQPKTTIKQKGSLN